MKELPEHIRSDPKKLTIALDHMKWLGDKTTQHVFQWLERRRATVAQRLTAAALSKTVQDNEVRVIAVELAEITTLQKAIYDTEQYVEDITRTN